MKKYFIALVALLFFITFSTNAQVNFDNQVIVYFKSGVQRNAPSNTTATISSANILNVLGSYGIPTVNVVPSFPSFIEADTVVTGSPKFTTGPTGEDSRQMNRAKVFTITITNNATKQNLINSLNALSEVLYAETNGKVSNNIIPIDGRFNQQWGMHNLTVPGADIHLDGATNIFTGNANSIIAIIDNGVDRLHNDLDAKIIGGDNGFVIDTDPLNPARQWSHGSHVAGIAAAISNNAGNNGVSGVDWQARIHPKNIFDGNGDPDIAQSIIDAVNFNANVWTFNNSWGTRNQDGTPGRYSVTIRSAFAQAYRNNRVSCIAMGNHHTGAPDANDIASFPASINSGVIAVGATNILDGVTGFSARGLHIDVSAPGYGIWSTNFNNGYIDLSGTSMATPHVAGLASLLKGFNTNLANDDIEQIIRLTADDRGAVGFDNQFGTGRINAQRALQTLQAPNTLQQLSTTAGTIFSTSASMTRIFLGFPGLPDAAYVVKRSEVRKAIALPVMCNTIGVWGRGVGTTGYREENGRCFGEGICEVVPGTLNAAGCTLRTWIYEVWSVNGQYLGFYPRTAANTVFQYTVLGVPAPTAVSGDNVVCGTSNLFTIPNLPAGATVAWSASPSSVVTINTPNASQTTITRINNGVITLTAVASNNCNGNPPATITKQVDVGIPVGAISFQRMGGSCYYQAVFTSTQLFNTYEWSDDGITYAPSGTGKIYGMYLPAPGNNIPVYAKATNSCGTLYKQRNFTLTTIPGGCTYRAGQRIANSSSNNAAPQISTNKVEVFPNPTARNWRLVVNQKITMPISLSLSDISGRLLWKYLSNAKTGSYFNIPGSNLTKGIYVLQVLINGTYQTFKLQKD